jgi:hypothetical protein
MTYENPPRVAELLLAWALGRGDGARTVLGDVSEEYSTVLANRGRTAAGLWYWKATFPLGRALWWVAPREDPWRG